MWKKSDDFSGEAFSRLLRSPQAQALARLLEQMDPDTLNRAASMASQGDTEGARKALSPVLEDGRVKRLLEDMEASNGGI